MSIFWCISITNYVTMGIAGLALFNVSNKFVCRLISSWLFGIQAFRKTAGFALEISCGWFHPKRDRLPKQRAEATKQKQNCSFFARKFSEEINFVNSGRLLIKKKGRKESSCGFCQVVVFNRPNNQKYDQNEYSNINDEWKEKNQAVVFAAAKLLLPARLIARQLNIEVNDIKAVIVSVFWYV